MKRGEGPASAGRGFALAPSLLSARLAMARAWFGRSSFKASRFVYVPPHLHLADPSVAADFLNGQIVLSGRSLLAGGRPILDLPTPSRAFAAAFNGFDWLRHFEASADPALRAGARELTTRWMERREKGRQPEAELPEALPRRVIAWVTHSVLLTENADFAAYRRLIDHLARDAAMLRVLAGEARIGLLRTEAALALAFHALSLDRPNAAIRQAQALLETALAQTIPEDGCPQDRDAGTAVRLAAMIVPLLALYRARQWPAPDILTASFQKLVAFIRMMQHPDGGLALFNGAGLVTRDLAAEVMRFGAGRVARQHSAPEGGFERLETDHGLLIVDTGRLPPPEFAGHAGASALAFEFSTKTDRLIVNCGFPPSAEGKALRSLRMASAHSGVLIDDLPLVDVESFRDAFGRPEDRVVSNEEGLPVQRRTHGDAVSLTIGHAGLRTRTGYLVEREFTLLPGDGGLAGAERAIDVGGQGESRRWTLVFHLHPRVIPEPLSRQDALILRLPHQPPGQDRWLFECAGIPLHIEESCCFEQEGVLPRTEAIILDIPIAGTTEIRWRLSPYKG